MQNCVPCDACDAPDECFVIHERHQMTNGYSVEGWLTDGNDEADETNGSLMKSKIKVSLIMFFYQSCVSC